VLSATEPILQFKAGNLYEVSPESAYAELEYEGSLAVNVSEGLFYVSPPLQAATPATITAGQVSLPFQFEGLGYSTYDLKTFFGSRPATLSAFPWSMNPFTSTITTPPAMASKAILFSAAFTVSFRVERGEVTPPEAWGVAIVMF
jgi:hypothetical protein